MCGVYVLVQYAHFSVYTIRICTVQICVFTPCKYNIMNTLKLKKQNTMFFLFIPLFPKFPSLPRLSLSSFSVSYFRTGKLQDTIHSSLANLLFAPSCTVQYSYFTGLHNLPWNGIVYRVLLSMSSLQNSIASLLEICKFCHHQVVRIIPGTSSHVICLLLNPYLVILQSIEELAW